jgi:hypothetical protein
MLVFFMIISYQACLVCKIISNSCPHDQFVLNCGLSTKLYISTISGFQSESEIPILIGQVRTTPDKSRQGLHWTTLVPSPDKSDALSIKLLGRFPDRI